MKEFIEDRLDKLEAKAENHSTRLINLQDRIGFAEAWHDDHENRLAIIKKQIAELEQIALKAQCNGYEYLSGCIEENGKCIGTLQTTQIKTLSELNRLSERMDALSARIDLRTQPYPGLENVASKQTFKIKGGWLNLYHTSPGKTVRAGALFSTRGEADAAAVGNDHRVACIHITDFTDGEGL